MESKQNNESESKVSIIFGKLSSNQLHDILENHGATKKETKAVFLISDNSAGIITVSYYSQEHEMVKHLRLGLTHEGWKMVPKPPREPAFTDTLEVKTKYMQDKAIFDEEMRCFLNTAKRLFEQSVTPAQIMTLSFELQKNELNLHGLIRPSRAQISQEKYYVEYVADVFVAEDIPGLVNINKAR